MLREDAGFHAYQVLEAGGRQFTAWGNADECRHILIAVTRTERVALPTVNIARRLMQGGELPQAAGCREDARRGRCNRVERLVGGLPI